MCLITLGTAIKSNKPPYHRMVVISDPKKCEGTIVLVTITSNPNWPDNDCIIQPSEWSELSKKSRVAYSTVSVGAASLRLKRAIHNGDFKVIKSPSKKVLDKIIEEGLKSTALTPEAKGHLERLN